VPRLLQIGDLGSSFTSAQLTEGCEMSRMKTMWIWILMLAPVLVLGVGATMGIIQDTKRSSDEGWEGRIRVDCRFVRGAELARLLGFNQGYGDRQSVYAIGWVLNDDPDRTAGAVRFRITVKSKEYTTRCDSGVSAVPRKGVYGRPFMVRMPAPLDEKVDLSEMKPVVEVLNVRGK
jgi:hypothetical protein